MSVRLPLKGDEGMRLARVPHLLVSYKIYGIHGILRRALQSRHRLIPSIPLVVDVILWHQGWFLLWARSRQVAINSRDSRHPRISWRVRNRAMKTDVFQKPLISDKIHRATCFLVVPGIIHRMKWLDHDTGRWYLEGCPRFELMQNVAWRVRSSYSWNRNIFLRTTFS